MILQKRIHDPEGNSFPAVGLFRKHKSIRECPYNNELGIPSPVRGGASQPVLRPQLPCCVTGTGGRSRQLNCVSSHGDALTALPYSQPGNRAAAAPGPSCPNAARSARSCVAPLQFHEFIVPAASASAPARPYHPTNCYTTPIVCYVGTTSPARGGVTALAAGSRPGLRRIWRYSGVGAVHRSNTGPANLHTCPLSGTRGGAVVHMREGGGARRAALIISQNLLIKV